MTPTAVDVLADALDSPGVFEDPLDDAVGLATDLLTALQAHPDKAAVVAALLDAETLAKALAESSDYTSLPAELYEDAAQRILAALRGQP